MLAWADFGYRLKELFTGELVRGARSILGIRVLWAGIAFAGHVVIAQVVGVEGYGRYSLIMAWLSVLALFGKLGFDESLVKFIPQLNTEEHRNKLKGLLNLAFGSVLVSSVLISLIGAGILGFWVEHGTAFYQGTQIALLFFPILCLSLVRQGALLGFGAYARSQAGDNLVRPSAILLLVAGLHWVFSVALDLPQLMWIVGLGVFLAFLIGIYWLRRTLPDFSGVAATYQTGYWVRTSLWMAMLSSSLLILNNTDLLMLGAMADMNETAGFAASARIATLYTFGLLAVNTAIGPLIAQSHGEGDRDSMQKLVRKGLVLTLIYAMAAGVFFLFGARFILGLFGEEFVEAWPVLAVILFSHFLTTLAGPTGQLMNMTGHHKQLALMVGVAALINIPLNLLLIPPFGAMGAAVASLISALSWKLYSLRYIQRELGIACSVFSLTQRPIQT